MRLTDGAATAVMWTVLRSMYWKLIEGTWLDLLMGEKGRKWTMGGPEGLKGLQRISFKSMHNVLSYFANNQGGSNQRCL